MSVPDYVGFADATVGWDSYHDEHYFGFNLHALVASVDGFDLPVRVSIDGGHTPDVLMGVEDLWLFELWLRILGVGAKIELVISDKGYDPTAFYEMCHGIGAYPVIPLANEPAAPIDGDDVPRDELGRPLCPGGLLMRRHGFDHSTMKTVYNCPCKRPGRENGKQLMRTHLDECPRGALCEPDTKMGPLYHLSHAADPRLNPAIPRGSEAFKTVYDRRTASERFFSTAKDAGGLGKRPYRRQHIYLFFAAMHAIKAHVKAWIHQLFPDGLGDAERVLRQTVGVCAEPA